MSCLYVVGTPIGNLGDLSPRAVETLEKVDFIAAEDTRVTLKLLNHFNIKKPLISYYEHNKREKGEIICNRILSGENCAIVTDAGMPCISDPGEELVKQCAERGIQVIAVPGPSAVVSALAISGLSTGRFTFEGFLSMNKKSRSEHLTSLKDEYRTMIFYESPHKVGSTLIDMRDNFGSDRRISIVRELTKIHEEVIRTTLGDAAEKYADGGLKGELVLVIEGAPPKVKAEYTLEDAIQIAKELMQSGTSCSESAKQAAAITKIKKADIYKMLNS